MNNLEKIMFRCYNKVKYATLVSRIFLFVKIY
nr:MAG TPA: hypothetical protein [Caudoviricetes sp.]